MTTAAAKTRTVAKSEKAITAAAIITRYDAVDDLCNEERRFYSECVHRIANGTASDEDQRAAAILARKHEFDFDSDCKALSHSHRVTAKYFDGGDFDQVIADATSNSVASGAALRELNDRHRSELQAGQSAAAEASARVASLTSARQDIERLRAEKPHLFTVE